MKSGSVTCIINLWCGAAPAPSGLGLRCLDAERERERAKLGYFPRASYSFTSMNHLTIWLPSKVLTLIWGWGQDRGREAIIGKGGFRSKNLVLRQVSDSTACPCTLVNGTRRLEEIQVSFCLWLAACSSAWWWKHFYLGIFLKVWSFLSWIEVSPR